MSEHTAIKVLVAQAKQLMLISEFIMVDGSPEAADIYEVAKHVAGTVYNYHIATDTILTADPYEPASNPRDYAAWYRLLELIGDTVSSSAEHWTIEVFQGSGTSYEYLIGLVRGLIASVLEDELRLDPVLRSLGNERSEKSEDIEAAARAGIAALRGNRPVNVDM